MSAIVTIALWTLAGFAALLAALLCLPIKVSIRYCSGPDMRLRVGVVLFAGATPTIPAYDSARPLDKPEKPEKPEEEDEKERGRDGPPAILRMVRAAPDLGAGMLKPIKVERLTIDGCFGLADPADTGAVYGLLAPFLFAVPKPSNVSLSLRPDFTEPRLSGEADGMFRFTPVAFLPPAARFAWRSFGP